MAARNETSGSELSTSDLAEARDRRRSGERDDVRETPAHVDSATSRCFRATKASASRRAGRRIQASFVDHPRDSVREADALVADLMQRLAGSFSDERQQPRGTVGPGDDVSTEDLRVALTRYRSFFDRLLSA